MPLFEALAVHTKGDLMKLTYLASAIFLMAGCSTSSNTSNSTPAEIEVSAPSLKAFRDICLESAPSFSTAEQAAIAHGITDIMDMEFTKAGFNSDKSLGVQIKAGKECVVTTPSQQDSTLTTQFLKVVTPFSSNPVVQQVPSKVTIENKTFIIMHDRNGGEAFVMLNPNG